MMRRTSCFRMHQTCSNVFRWQTPRRLHKINCQPFGWDPCLNYLNRGHFQQFTRIHALYKIHFLSTVTTPTPTLKKTYPKNPTPKNKNNKTNKRTFSPFSFGISLRIRARKKKIFKTPAQNAHGGERSHPMSSWSSVGYSNLGDSWAFESCPFQGLSGLL